METIQYVLFIILTASPSVTPGDDDDMKMEIDLDRASTSTAESQNVPVQPRCSIHDIHALVLNEQEGLSELQNAIRTGN